MSKLSAVFLLTLLVVQQVQEVSARSSFMRSQVDRLSQDGRRRRREMERDVPDAYKLEIESHQLANADTIEIDFGGKQHEQHMARLKNNTQSSSLRTLGSYRSRYHKRLTLARPEFVKSDECTNTKCTVCSDKKACWAGVGSDHIGALAISLKPEHSFVTYGTEVWARCNSSDSKWVLQVQSLNHGVIAVYIDYKFVWDVKNASLKGLKLPVPRGKDAHVRIVFVPDPTPWPRVPTTGFYYVANRRRCPPNTLAGSLRRRRVIRVTKCAVPVPQPSAAAGVTAGATVALKAVGVKGSVEKCMAIKDCLALLGDGTEASFTLGNNPEVQLACLQGRQGSMSTAVQAKCVIWKACIVRARQISLKDYLIAAVGDQQQKGALVESRRRKGQHPHKTQDPHTCMDPSSEDPEAWSCECLGYMKRLCKNADGEEHECFKDYMCRHTDVCQSWKDDVGCSDSLVALAKRQHASGDTTDSMDAALDGKCAA